MLRRTWRKALVMATLLVGAGVALAGEVL